MTNMEDLRAMGERLEEAVTQFRALVEKASAPPPSPAQSKVEINVPVTVRGDEHIQVLVRAWNTLEESRPGFLENWLEADQARCATKPGSDTCTPFIAVSEDAWSNAKTPAKVYRVGEGYWVRHAEGNDGMNRRFKQSLEANDLLLGRDVNITDFTGKVNVCK